jgi:cytochrome c peroxidase
VMDFYAFRDVAPQKVYPGGAKYDDIPAAYRVNVDTVDPPFDRNLGDPPAITEPEEDDIIAFLKTLTDGYKPGP